MATTFVNKTVLFNVNLTDTLEATTYYVFTINFQQGLKPPQKVKISGLNDTKNFTESDEEFINLPGKAVISNLTQQGDLVISFSDASINTSLLTSYSAWHRSYLKHETNTHRVLQMEEEPQVEIYIQPADPEFEENTIYKREKLNFTWNPENWDKDTQTLTLKLNFSDPYFISSSLPGKTDFYPNLFR